MIEWEYAYLQTKVFSERNEEFSSASSAWKQYLECTFHGATGSSQPVRASSVIPILNGLGKDGWEAFYIEAIQGGGIWWLKRPVSP